MSGPPSRAQLYWETIRHLRLSQIWRRILFRALRPAPDTRPAPPARAWTGRWAAPAPGRQSQSGPDEFRFLNETRSLGVHGWDDPSVPRLWRYNLHYFDDLNAEEAAERTQWHRDLIARWIAENPAGQGTAWEPYPTSRRIVNWVKWARAGNTLPDGALDSLAAQARWLTRRLEYHLLGNHLMTNAKALVFAGSFFDGPEAKGWRELGQRILAREIPEQILPDGGHFELSPMYHALALEDLLDLVNVTRATGLEAPADWANCIGAMRAWLAAMCHSDGEIAFFNDAAIGVAPAPAALEHYAVRLDFPPLAAERGEMQWLRDSGYVRLERDGVVAILDVARVGPDHLPGHAHADTLGFEMSLNGRRAIVNSGTSIYGEGPERQRQRGTAAHNTVIVDGENSSEVWAGFRVARRARPFGLSVTRDGEEIVATCAHDGYRRLPGRPIHLRTWRFRTGGLTVVDRVEGRHDRAVAAFHFHAEASVSATADGRSGEISLSHGARLNWTVETGAAWLEAATHHPAFGVSLPSRRLCVDLAGGESVVAFSWAGA